MKLINSVIYCSFISCLFISATQAAADPKCDVTAQSFAHIQQRHCTFGVQASQFLPQYCATIQDAQKFCEQVQMQPINHEQYSLMLVLGMMLT